MKHKRRLSEFLAEVSEMRWDDFVTAELDMSYSTSESIIFSLIRACAMEQLSAIKTSFGRLDGKMATPVRVITPKVYFTFPNATEAMQVIVVENPNPEPKSVEVATVEEMKPILPTKGFRETMDRMIDSSREIPKAIIEAQEQVEKFIRNAGRRPANVPKVKSVVVAHILHMAQERNMESINEVFDQMDGKLVETFKLLGDDMYIMKFDEIAPQGAFKNEDGVWTIEAGVVQEMWRQKLEPGKPGILEGNN